MNYSRNLRREAMARRIIASWAIVALVFLLIGGVSGYGLKTHITAKQTVETEEQRNTPTDTKYLVYGAYDDRVFEMEMSLDWGVGDLPFVPVDCGLPEEQQEFLYYLCAGYNIDWTVALAIIAVESEFNPDALGKTDDYGLMQINKINHEWLTETIGVTDYFDPYQNMRAGCFILRKLFEKYQEPELVLMCYNMGETGAARLWNKDVFSTKYTTQVLAAQHGYVQQLEELEGEASAGELESN